MGIRGFVNAIALFKSTFTYLITYLEGHSVDRIPRQRLSNLNMHGNSDAAPGWDVRIES